MNDLMLSPNSQRVSREELLDVPTPQGTRSWKPVPHYDVASLVVNEAEERGFCVLTEEFGLNPAGTKMFGVLTFHAQGNPEFHRSLGIRNSHDRSLALGLVVGVKVLVCENLAFGGDVAIHRKHTSGMELKSLVPRAFNNLLPQYDRLELNIERLKGQSASLNDARIIAVKAAENGAIPSCEILPVVDEFQNPRHEEFKPRNRWSLLNAFTEIGKKFSPARSDKFHRKISTLFGLN